MALDPGTYQLLVLGHSANSNPTLTSAEKIQFTNDMGIVLKTTNQEDVVSALQKAGFDV